MIDSEPAAAVHTSYGVIQMPAVMEFIDHASATAKWPLQQAIWQLQNNPRPVGHEPQDQGELGIAIITVQKTSPPYYVHYIVDDAARRVTIIAISEARWRRR